MYIPYNPFVTDAVTFCEINVFIEFCIRHVTYLVGKFGEMYNWCHVYLYISQCMG